MVASTTAGSKADSPTPQGIRPNPIFNLLCKETKITFKYYMNYEYR